MSKTAFENLAKFTLAACNVCPVPEREKERHKRVRCCARVFCSLVRNALPAEANYPWNADAEIPFMGAGGRCVVPPEHRLFCAGFVCPGHLRDKQFRRKYERLCAKAKLHPVQAPKDGKRK